MLFETFLFLFFIRKSIQIEFNGQYSMKPGPLIHSSNGDPWPKPQQVDQLDDKYYTVLPSFFKLNNVGNTCKILEEALDRYRTIIIFNNRVVKEVYYQPRTCYSSFEPRFLGYLTDFDVELTGTCNDDDYPSFDMKEDYELTISGDTKKLTSSTVWGILRGLETLSQLIYLTEDYSCHRIDSVSINDYPRLAHRGFLLDTSRHYHTKEDILRLIDTLSYHKFNVFHWHIVDDYSFPYVSTTFPELSKEGAFHPTLMVYDQDFIKQVIEHSRMRGIRVIPEFDSPGHTLSWGLGNPDFLTKCHGLMLLDYGPVDPTKNSTFEFMFKLYDEINEVFPDKYIFLGGDEVDFSCWQSNSDVNYFMAQNNMEGDYAALQSYYLQKLIGYTDSLGLTSIVWEEAFTNGVNLSKSALVNVWKSDDPKTTLGEVTAAGHSVILSAYWYLDILESGGDWEKFYLVDPLDFPGSDEQKELVIGGEACMWSEVVDSNNLEPRVWPRASAVAEKFWSAAEPPAESLLEGFTIAGRLEEQTCRLRRRGIRAEPPTGPSFCL